MKKLSLLFVMCLAALIMAGCAKPADKSMQIAAEKFVEELYTVSSEEAENYNRFLELRPADVNELVKAIEANDDALKSMMTDKSYNVLVNNRQNLMFAQYCALNDCTMQVMDVKLTEKEGGAEAGRVDYDFEVKVRFVSKDGTVLDTDSGKGFMRLTKEGNDWKVSDYRGLEYPKEIVVN
ncbi:MAG: hypothetical protein AAGU76_18570 [Sedimentibacter sp.]|uniref:hypothetical protein n=1 Tax=Sedimentibacter sp. TaxID=1960295 RepID=UPI003158109C